MGLPNELRIITTFTITIILFFFFHGLSKALPVQDILDYIRVIVCIVCRDPGYYFPEALVTSLYTSGR